MTISADLRRWARGATTAVLFAAIVATSSAQFVTRAALAAPPISLESLCSQRFSLDELRAGLRLRIRAPVNDARFDDILSNVMLRVARVCVKGSIPDNLADQEARLNTIIRDSRVEAQRRNKAYEFQEEVLELAPAESHVTGDEILDVIDKKANSRQKIVFEMLAQGQTQEEIAEHVGVSVGTVNADAQKVKKLLKEELALAIKEEPARLPRRGGRATVGRAATTDLPKPAGNPQDNLLEKSMTRVKSPIGAEVLTAIKNGATVMPTGTGYAGEVMTVTLPSSQLSQKPVDGIIMLPTPIVLTSDAAGEQEMVVTAVREIGEGINGKRTFALSAFCKDEALNAPSDLSRYTFKSAVSDPKITEIVTRGDYRQPELISERLWSHLKG